MFAALVETPRKMLPPPTTIAIWVPIAWACLISSATLRATFTSIPKDCSPRRASPESFSSTRRKAGEDLSAVTLVSSFVFRVSGSRCGVRARSDRVTLIYDPVATAPGTDLRLTLRQFRDLVAKIIVALRQAFAHLVSRESADRNFLARLRDLFRYKFAHGLRRVFNERLVQ